MSDEVKTENPPEAAPAPAPVAETTEKQIADALKVVEKPKDAPTDAAFARLRKEKREAEQKAAALEAKLAEKEKALPSETAGPKKTDVFDDPDAWAEDVKRQAREEAIAATKRLKDEESGKEAAHRAAAWLLSQNYYSEDEAFKRDVLAYLTTEKGQRLASVDPEEAAYLAFSRACDKRGIVKDAQPDARSTVGIRASAPQTGGKRVFNRREVQSYIYTTDPGKDIEGFRKRLREVEEAEKEGRIK